MVTNITSLTFEVEIALMRMYAEGKYQRVV